MLAGCIEEEKTLHSGQCIAVACAQFSFTVVAWHCMIQVEVFADHGPQDIGGGAMVCGLMAQKWGGGLWTVCNHLHTERWFYQVHKDAQRMLHVPACCSAHL